MGRRLRAWLARRARGCPSPVAVFSAVPFFLWAAADPDNLSVFDPASAPAASIRKFFYLVLAIVGAIFLLVEGMILYCVVRFRRKSDADATEPPQIFGSAPLEIAWTLAPLLIVFVLFLIVMRSVAEVRLNHPPEGSMQVNVVGHQWWWEFEYPGQEVVTANELHIPLSEDGRPRPIFLQLHSADVVHSFWVPRLSGKTDVIPGRQNKMWFRADLDGVFTGQCAEYCGAQHANMIIRVIAEPEADFQRWLERQRQPARDVPAGRAGKAVFLANACVNCHTIRGTEAHGTFGPDLTHLMSRKTLASGMVPNNAENLRDWITDPQRVKPDCKMPAMRLGQDDFNHLLAYLLTLD